MRVLIVEDDQQIATYLKRGLEEQGYAVDTAVTGREALAWADVVSFDLIVLDIMLPELDGISVCHLLRSRGNEAAILMLTARDAIDDRVTGLDAEQRQGQHHETDEKSDDRRHRLAQGHPGTSLILSGNYGPAGCGV